MPARRASSACVSLRFVRNRWIVMSSRFGDMLVLKTNIFKSDPALPLQHHAQDTVDAEPGVPEAGVVHRLSFPVLARFTLISSSLLLPLSESHGVPRHFPSTR